MIRAPRMDAPRRTRRRPLASHGRGDGDASVMDRGNDRNYCHKPRRPRAFPAVVGILLYMVGTHAFLSPTSPSLRTVGVNRGKASPLPPSFRRESVVVMGIPKLFRWLVDLYPAVQQRVGETLGTETAKVENFYLDMNGIIHMCTHANAEELIVLDERK
ncbi:5 -3 exoribonuclease, partial [Nannochloropsis gaditana CCMP526]|uniref:5 -3 exoribonuclease n=1 Tax=Nannochloropsis gaditana (strain CCMP526) TaxID=1093141 RepID=UPI00029F7252